VSTPPDDLARAAGEGTVSAGEGGSAAYTGMSPTRRSMAEVFIEEIPDEHDISVMRWAARCSNPEHDLLGHFDSEQAARQAKDAHLASEHSH